MTRLKKSILTISLLAFVPFTAVLSTPAGGAVKARNPPWYAPILSLPKWTLPTWSCILHNESRSTFEHPNLGDNNPYGSSGIFQIEQSTWAAHQLSVGIPYSIKVWGAGPLLQAKVAAAIWRANGFGQWTRYDGC